MNEHLSQGSHNCSWALMLFFEIKCHGCWPVGLMRKGKIECWVMHQGECNYGAITA